ncbi:hypothetical protein GRI69_11610 [Erythrobacter vulgaris]|uniref:Uncharacterized protein n=1 Tax=Qipengyuania vulgaris TaxID=291985 RepID=A0A844XTX3_9SPHN|nr:hypothetical protein [Qipengyuania vulgaris]MXO48904.1 hypothetical protein [Qipengyuania vulgaris]
MRCAPRRTWSIATNPFVWPFLDLDNAAGRYNRMTERSDRSALYFDPALAPSEADDLP